MRGVLPERRMTERDGEERGVSMIFVHGERPCGRKNRAKRFFAVLSALVLLFPLCSSAARADRTVRVGIYENEPKVFTSSSGVPSGLFVDILESIAREEKWTLDYVPGTWQEGLGRLAWGDIDLMPDVAYTSEREHLFAFHGEPVVSDWFQLFARKGSGIHSIVDLRGKRVAVLAGSIQQDAFTRHATAFDLDVRLVPFSLFAEAFRAVQAGSADAVIANRFNGPLLMKEYGLEDTAVVFSPTRVYFAAPKSGDAALLEAIDRHLARLKRDPGSVYYDALRRWTSEELPGAIPHWLKVTGGALAAISLVGLVGMWLLQRLVNKRTKELRIFVEALKQADREWKATFDSVEDAVWVLDCEGRIAHANQATTRIFGKAPEDVTGRTCWEVAHETDEAIPECPLKDAAAKRQSRNATVHTKDGRWLQVSVHPVFDEEGTTKGFMHVVSDVTEKQRTEEELDRYRRGLEDLVRRRTEELETANADLLQAKLAAESADHLKSAFLATMSHELRTPLNSIIGFTGILLQGLAGPLNEEQAKQLRMVQGSARHLLALINDVLDISKIEAGRIELAEEPFDLRVAVERVAQSVAPAAKEKGLELTCEIGEGVGRIVGDRRRVEQVLMNLLSNAVKFTARGSVTVTCTREDSSAIMSVKDTGIGISAENLQKLFRPFQQVDSGKTREYDGTGLGLHISKRLGELMGGSISVESTPGSGSTFTFRMPIREGGGA